MEKIDFKKIKCLIIDFDNTLTNSKREITDYTREVISKIVNKGIYVVLCTGRPNIFAIEKSKYCHASPIVITDNGALIYNYELNKVYYSLPIPKDILEEILNLCKDNNVDCIYNSPNNRYRYQGMRNRFIPDIDIIDSINDINNIVTQIVISSEDIESIKKCAQIIDNIKDIKINNTSLNTNTNRKYAFCDLNMNGVSKGIAIQKLMDMLDIANDEIVCFGDSLNDISMFKACKYSVAMKNAEEVLKEQAYMITEYDNDEDGLAKFLNKYFWED